MFQVSAQEGAARLGVFSTPHGTVQTPAFMNVATGGAIRGAVAAEDMQHLLGTQVMLCNTYHLHVRPGDALVHACGGLRGFTGWQGVTLTDSGGFQVFSLAKLRQITEAGVTFASHVDGRKIFMGPEESLAIQANLGSTIAMAFDECVANPATHAVAAAACGRTLRWLGRSLAERERQRNQPHALNPQQLLFGINQGSVYEDLRVAHMQQIAALDCDGYAIGGLAVGEPKEDMYRIVAAVEPHMPPNKPRYLMGVGTPGNILEAVRRGIDLFDCVMPTRNGRHGHMFTQRGVLNLHNKKYARDTTPIDPTCTCPVCQQHSRAYVRHLLKAGEMLAQRLCVLHNLYFYNHMMAQIRDAIAAQRFDALCSRYAAVWDARI